MNEKLFIFPLFFRDFNEQIEDFFFIFLRTFNRLTTPSRAWHIISLLYLMFDFSMFKLQGFHFS